MAAVMSNAWLLLLLAGLLEVVWAIGLKYTMGFTRIVPSVITVTAMIGSVWLLALALRIDTGGHRLCGVDRHRRNRHGDSRRRSVWRSGDHRAAGLHRTDRRRNIRTQTLRLIRRGSHCIHRKVILRSQDAVADSWPVAGSLPGAGCSSMMPSSSQRSRPRVTVRLPVIFPSMPQNRSRSISRNRNFTVRRS